MYLALRKLAAATERPTDELLQIYGLEGFLDRLVQSQHASQFVLKGGVLLAAFNARRPTRDVDLAKTGVADDVDSTRQTMNEILTVVIDDGLIFDTAATTVESIRDGARYEGTRARIFGTLSTGQIRFHVDINFGDPLWPQPESVDIPRSLGGQPIHILGYRIELVLAEKIVTAIQRGTANTRWRDFVDISNLAEADIEDGSLMEAARSHSILYEKFWPAMAPSPSSDGRHGAESSVSSRQLRSFSLTFSNRSWPSVTHCSALSSTRGDLGNQPGRP